MDYIAASDMLVHPSVSEASNQVVREAGLRGKPCIVCRDVGDFNEYITDRETGFLVSKENPEQEIFSIIKEFYHRKDELSNIGKRHCERIIKLFAIEGIVDRYLEIV
jgi:glycosyltransferase involved in cell wall biosynthesis